MFRQVAKEFESISGRKYDVLEKYRTDDAEYVAISMGSTAGTMKQVVDELREEGKKVGCIKLRLFRPFPSEDIAKALEGKKGVAVMDRALSFGASGPMFPEVRSAMFDMPDDPMACNYIYGLGGRDIGTVELKQAIVQMMSGNAKTLNFLGVKQ